MLRLRMTAGRVTQEKLAFVAKAIRDYQVPRVHFTTGQTIQFHDLHQEELCALWTAPWTRASSFMGAAATSPERDLLPLERPDGRGVL